MNKPFIILIVFLITLQMFGCAANRFASVPAGTTIQEVRESFGTEKTTISYPDYFLLVYETQDATNYTVLKFIDGKFKEKGLIPKWVINSSSEAGSAKKLEVRQYYSMAMRLRKQGLHQDAYSLMERYIKDNPDTSMGYTYLSMLYCQDSLFDRAISTDSLGLVKLINKKSFLTLKQNAAATFMKAEKYDEAEMLLNELLNDPNVEHKHGVHYNMACLLSIRNEKEGAIEHLKYIIPHIDKGICKKMLDDDPDMNNIRNEPGYLEIYNQLPEKKMIK